jgi:putative NADH-flavin reductase
MRSRSLSDPTDRSKMIDEPDSGMFRERVTVIGATGGIGRQVVEKALAAGHEVRALVRDPSRLNQAGVSVVAGDLADGEAIDRAVEGSDAVIWARRSDSEQLRSSSSRRLPVSSPRR